MVKKYHELAHFRNEEGEVVGFYLLNTENKQMELVTRERMLILCKAGEVQYFGWDDRNDTYTIAYTAEELASMGKSSALASELDSLEKYFGHDVRIPGDYFDVCRSNPEIVICVASTPMRMPLVGTVFTFLLLGGNGAITRFVASLPEGIQKNCLESKYGLFLQIPWKAFGALLRHLVEDGEVFDNVLFSTETIKSIPEDMKPSSVKKRLGLHNPLVKDTKFPELAEGIVFFDSITEENLQKFMSQDENNHDPMQMSAF